MSRKPITIIIVALSLLIGAVAFQFLFSNFYFLNSSPDASAAPSFTLLNVPVGTPLSAGLTGRAGLTKVL